MSEPKISLVTGGAGFIGSHIVKHLLAMNHQVIVLDDLSTGEVANLEERVIFFNGSVLDETILKKIFSNYRINYIYHLAAYAAEYLSNFRRQQYYETNVIGSINLINYSIQCQIDHFIFVSSIAVYGHCEGPMKEEYGPKPADPYGITKLAIELDLQSASEMFGIKYTIFRPHNVYGPRQSYLSTDRNVVGIFINCILNEKPTPVFGNGEQTRSFTYIDDVAPYIASCIAYKGAMNQIINIGASARCSIVDLVGMISNKMNKKNDVVFLPSRREALHAYSDHSKFVNIFSPPSETSLDIGIAKTIEWIKERQLK